MRVIEYHVQVDGQDVPEMSCLITGLLDYRACPAGLLAAAYRWRQDGSQTALREVKSAIRGAGPSTGPVFRSATPDLIRAEHAARITACELVRATARAAARAAQPARKGHRQPPRPDPPRRPPDGPARAGQAAREHQPRTAPRPPDQSPAGIPRRRTRYHHPHRARHHHHLRPARRVTFHPGNHRTAHRIMEPAAPAERHPPISHPPRERSLSVHHPATEPQARHEGRNSSSTWHCPGDSASSPPRGPGSGDHRTDRVLTHRSLNPTV